MTWVVTVPLWRAGKGVPIDERIEQLEIFKRMTGRYAVPFDSEEKASDAAFLWSQALGFSVVPKRRIAIPTDDGSHAEKQKRPGRNPANFRK